MKKRIAFLFMIVMCIVFFCCKGLLLDKKYLKTIASPIFVKKQIDSISIKDYIPTDIRIKKVKIGDSIFVQIKADSTSLLLDYTKFKSPISNVHLKTNKGDFDIPIINSKFNTKDSIPELEYVKQSKIHVSFRIKNHYDSIFLYINNKLYDNSLIKKKGKLYKFILPLVLKDIPYGCIRIYAYSKEKGLSKELYIPIQENRIIDDTEDIIDDSEKDDLSKILLSEKDYAYFYLRAFNSFVSLKYSFGYLDKKLQKTLLKYGINRIAPRVDNHRYYEVNFSNLLRINTDIQKYLNRHKKLKKYKNKIRQINMLNIYMLTIPGMPSYYYKQNENMLAKDSREMSVDNLLKLRKENLALVFGNFKVVRIDKNTYAYIRIYKDDFAICIFNKSNYMEKLCFKIEELKRIKKSTSLFNSRFDIVKDNLLIKVQPNSAEVIYGKIS